MDLYIFDGNTRKVAGIIESYEYLRWTRRYSRCGAFELKAIATTENLALLQIGNFLWKNDDAETGIVEFVEYTQGEQEYITVSGRFLTGLLSRRIIWTTETLKGDITAVIGQLLNNHLLNPTDTNRTMTDITFHAVTLGVAVNTQISYKNLMGAVCDLCDNADIGIRTEFNPANGDITITLYRGAETSAVFSKEYENVIEQVFTHSLAEFANVALVGGEGEGSQRQFVTVGAGAGIERREVWVDAKDLQSADFPTGYTDALIFRGQSRLAELAPIQAFDSVVNQYGNLGYKSDFDIGSRVRAESVRWGVSITARITEIAETYDRDGLSLEVTFGKPLLTLAEKLQREGL
jgi:hypothetical protein